MEKFFELNTDNAPEYLRSRQAVGDGELLIRSLGGGVANTVLMVFETQAGEPIGSDVRLPRKADERMTQGRCFVLKQPLEFFRTAATWRVDRERVWMERDALELLAKMLPHESLPQVLWSDRENYILAISAAPAGSIMWKTALLEGKVDRRIAEQMGILLAMLHTSTLNHPGARERFSDPELFVQQRIEPYFQSLRPRHPDLSDAIDRLCDHLLTQQLCLIHGDFSPKNILVQPQSLDVFWLDWEVTFFGHPGFDLMTLLNHLMLKAFLRPAQWRSYMVAADSFWQAYSKAVNSAFLSQAQAHAGSLLGALLLARVDGKSPAEYLSDETLKERIRQTGRELLKNPPDSVDETLDRLADALAH